VVSFDSFETPIFISLKGTEMFLVALLFVGLWIAGLATSYTMGGFIHVLLILGIILMFSRMIRSNHSSRLAEIRATQPAELQNPTK
jgi:hypothetical protein